MITKGILIGFDPRQHIANFIHHVPQQQPSANDMLHNSNATKAHSQSQQSQHSNTKIKQQRSSQNCNQPQQQTHLLTTAIAFPGNPLQHNSQPQQHLQPQQQQQHAILIPATSSTASQVRNVSSVSFTNSAANWPCPACKIPYKSASELQAHLRYLSIITFSFQEFIL